MNTRRTILASVFTLGMLATSFVMPTAAIAAPPATGSLTTSIMQVIPGVGTFTGTLTTTSFKLVGGVIQAAGTVSGTLTALDGTTVLGSIVNQVVSIPLTGFTGNCTILTLRTGAINLNILGLNVALAPIDLVITAQAGPGNLLGNLLCAVANLLNAGGPLQGVVGLLNQILGAIRLV